jgi:hypothetical protein
VVRKIVKTAANNTPRSEEERPRAVTPLLDGSHLTSFDHPTVSLCVDRDDAHLRPPIHTITDVDHVAVYSFGIIKILCIETTSLPQL